MSYYCRASFKKISNDINELQRFFSLLKTYASDETIAKAIINENEFYCPLLRMDTTNISKVDAFHLPELEYWIVRLFTFRWRLVTYGNDTLLCMLGVPSQLEPLFDANIDFQNSSDQDYERDEWQLESFEQIYDRWQNVSREEVFQFLRLDTNDLEEWEDDIYFRKTAAYKEIASPVEELLYTGKTAYVQLFSPYDNLFELNHYKRVCVNLPKRQFKEEDK